MTPEERKRSLRATFEAKVVHIHSNSVQGRVLYPKQVDMLWEIIDGLVDECAALPTDTGVQYRCLWVERIGNLSAVPFSGKVGDLGACIVERAARIQDSRIRGVMIEARPASDGEWPRPWDAVRPADSPEAIAKAAERAGQPYDAMTEGGE